MTTLRQKAATLITPVREEKIEDLSKLLQEIGDNVEENPLLPFAEFACLHFCSFVIIPVDGAKHCLVWELNFDGALSDLLAEFVQRASSGLDEIYKYCVGYTAQSMDNHKARIAFLKAQDRGTNTFYAGCRGRTVAAIKREGELRNHIEEYLDAAQTSGSKGKNDPEGLLVSIQEYLRSIPTLNWCKEKYRRPFLVRYGRNITRVVLFSVLFFTVIFLLVLVAISLFGGDALQMQAITALAMLLAPLLIFGAILRNKERSDSVAPANWSSNHVTSLFYRENYQVQNHMASVTRIKPGWFRGFTLRLVLFIINLAGVFYYNRGRLGDIASIHFARWVVVDRQTLLFLSNYDGTWESYLDEFIDRAARGLTAVWSNTEGFPRARYLILDGALDEDGFKAYARGSQVPTLAWYSAYKKLTVENIDNNTAIGEGLFSPLVKEDLRVWLRRF